MSADMAVAYLGLDGLIPAAEYTVHNATDEPVVLQYDGETRTVPPFNGVLAKNKSYPDVAHSLQDEKGDYVKGTLVIRDVPGTRDHGEGATSVSWSAAACIQHCLGIDPRSQKAYGILALKGVSFIPRGASKELTAKIITDGRARYIGWMEENCVAIVTAHEENNRSRVRNGAQPNPPDKRVRIAQGILEASRKRDAVQAEATLSEMEKIISDAIPASPDEDAELKKIAKSIAEELASDMGLMGNSELLAQRVMQDPEAMKIMRSKFKMRKLKDAQDNAPDPADGVDVDLTA